MPRITGWRVIGVVVLLLLSAGIVGRIAFHAKNPTVHVVTISSYGQYTVEDAHQVGRVANHACDNGWIWLLIGQPSKVTVIETFRDSGGQKRKQVVHCDLFSEDE
jgi:hypothetical protein